MTGRVAIPRIVIAGAASSVGKTTVTAGIIAALTQQGLVVQPFKCGPDYVDPSYHERAAQRACRNLDAWMLDADQMLEGFVRACHGADIAIIEGVMGLFDGGSWDNEHGSTAQIAKLLDSPVLLVVDIAGAARSAAVTVLGCQHFDPQVALRAVVLNFAGSAGHAEGCAKAITRATQLPVLGWLPRDPQLAIPERHLGLVPGGEQTDVDALLAEIARAATQRFDLPTILALATDTSTLASPNAAAPQVARSRPAPRPLIAVAKDAGFCFYYPENLELLVEAGADIEFFRPVQGERPDPRATGVYLGGGYPELHGAALASNVGLWDALRELHERDAPIYAECGGFMVLLQALIDSDGEAWNMAALVPGVARMNGKLAALGYRHATARCENLLGGAGEIVRGHEFRYSRWECATPLPATATAWDVQGTRGSAASDSGGYVHGNLLGSYLHVHFGQSPLLAVNFVDRLRRVA